MRRTPFRHSRVFAVVLLVAAGSGRATTVGIPDSDSATLLALLMQAVKDSAQMGQVLTTAKQSLETAQYMSASVRSMVEVYDEAKNIFQDPKQIFDAGRAAFTKTFPELQAIQHDAEALRRSFSGRSTGGLNPFAYQELIKNAGLAGESLYQTLLMMDEDVYGLTKEHLAAKQTLDELALGNEERRRLLRTASLTPQGFIAETAKATADTAVATSLAATSLQELVRLQRLEQVKAHDAAARAGTTADKRLDVLGGAAGIDPSLDPTKPLKDDVPAGPALQ